MGYMVLLNQRNTMCCAFLLQQCHPLGVYVPAAAYDAVQVYAAVHTGAAVVGAIPYRLKTPR